MPLRNWFQRRRPCTLFTSSNLYHYLRVMIPPQDTTTSADGSVPPPTIAAPLAAAAANLAALSLRTAVTAEPKSVPVPSTMTMDDPLLPPLGTMRVEIVRLHLNRARVHCDSPWVRVSLGDQERVTLVRDEPDGELTGGNGEPGMATWNWGDTLELHVTYHAQLFSSLQLDVLDAHIFVSDSLVARSELRVASLTTSRPSPARSSSPLIAGLPPNPFSSSNNTPPSLPTSHRLALPLFDPYHTPSRRPHLYPPGASPTALLPSELEDAASTPALGTLEVRLWYTPQTLEHQQLDDTVYRLLSPRELSGNSAALLDAALRAVSLSVQTRETLSQLLKLVQAFRQGVDGVSAAEWVCGLLLLTRYYESLAIQRTGKLIGPSDRSVVASLLYYKKFAMAAYGWKGLLFFGKSKIPNNKRSMMSYLPQIPAQDWLSHDLGENDVFKPSHFVVHDRQKNALVIVIRGSMSAVDAVTDLACEYVRLNDGLVHRGIKVAADYLAAILIPRLPEWVADRAPAHIIVVGHSLGAGTATLLTMLLKDHVLAGLSTLLPPSRPPLQLHCYAYGPPPTCSRNLADAYADQITVLVNEHDIVCRLSYGSVIDLRTCLLAAVAGIDNHATEVLSLLTRSSSSNRRRNGLPALPVDDRLQAIFDVITQTRATLQETQINPKLYLAGKVYRVHYDYQQLGSSTPSTESLSGPTSIPVSPPIERTASPAPVAPEPLSASGVMGIGAAAPSTTIAKTQALGTTVSMSASPPPLLDTSHTSGGSLPRLVSHARRASAEVFKTLFPRSNSSSIAQTGSAASTDAATASQGSLLADVPTATEVQGVPVPPLSRSPSSNSSNKGGDPSPRANSPRTASPSGTAAVGVECGPVPWAAMGLFATPMMQPRPTFATPRPEPTATVPPPPTTEDSTSAGESAILPDPAPSASMPGLLTSPTTGSTAPAVAVPTKGGVVKVPMRVVLEETPCEALAELEVRRNMFVQHMPDAYERALSRWLASDEDQLD